MKRLIFDLEVLRTFVTGVELGSFSKAAKRLNRSTSAVSAQLKKLEDQIGKPVLRKVGRGLALTAVGESVLGYARRLLELNDEAAMAIRGFDLQGCVRLGISEDFESLLTDILWRFARTHPQVKIEAKLARNSELLEQVTAGRLDLALAWDIGAGTPHFQTIGQLPMCWIGSMGNLSIEQPNKNNPLSLVMLEAPCLMRTIAINALDHAKIPWRIAFTSPNLSGVWAAVAAGLGITVRTEMRLSDHLKMIDSKILALPPLPTFGLAMYYGEPKPNPVIKQFSDIIQSILRQSLP